ncbi:hypothetical protein FISHEDRAFT_64372 [Fistulina hepatica ATCC 64428]|uniref:Aromatic amino acid beta-eliminating lyase/threonine aldolase domain-containing protein n=1 Tax=Fistulina hepatica ATCC 64428 TaxID=1128425 RepID=A0A0D7AHQ1_9AGAR|nr:hypothetical protein FISHEDRAFT_64372 [Fistulina hepatica ATCC 64428]
MSSSTLEIARAAVADLVKVDVLPASPLAANAAYRKAVSRAFVLPTPEMYAYAVNATLGDDVYDEPSTKALETHVAQLTGKEAAVFMPSGTASNQIALRTHLQQPPHSVLCDSRAHIYKYEAGGCAFHSGAQIIPVKASNSHHLTLTDIQKNLVLGDDIHTSPTRVIELENTLNGMIFPQDEIVRISEYAHANGIIVHLDGARLWHVAAETGTTMKELCDPLDSVSLCFSKGLGAPIGSMLVGPKAYIQKARWFRKMFGGGMRQTGILAASAAYALTHNFPQLVRVHALAKRLAAGLEEIGVTILSVDTCMVFYDPAAIGVTYEEIGNRGAALSEPLTLGGSRLVVHLQTTDEAVDDLLAVIRTLAEEKKQAGFVRPAVIPPREGDIYVRRTSK